MCQEEEENTRLSNYSLPPQSLGTPALLNSPGREVSKTRCHFLRLSNWLTKPSTQNTVLLNKATELQDKLEY